MCAGTYNLKDEWAYVVAPVPMSAGAAVGSGFGVRDGAHAGYTPEDFMNLANEHVQAQRAAHPQCCGLPAEGALLTLDEVLAVRLYTGPGHQPLNDFLRQLGKLSGVVRDGVATHPGLTFTATTALLCSAIRKLAAVRVPQHSNATGLATAELCRCSDPSAHRGVWAGHLAVRARRAAVPRRARRAAACLLGGGRARLTSCTHSPRHGVPSPHQRVPPCPCMCVCGVQVEDAQGMICAVDAGFMSTSKNRETPIHYMGGATNVLWELFPSGESDMAFHRGASVEMLSQFAGEEEARPTPNPTPNPNLNPNPTARPHPTPNSNLCRRRGGTPKPPNAATCSVSNKRPAVCRTSDLCACARAADGRDAALARPGALPTVFDARRASS
jgi:hypothetical protein